MDVQESGQHSRGVTDPAGIWLKETTGRKCKNDKCQGGKKPQPDYTTSRESPVHFHLMGQSALSFTPRWPHIQSLLHALLQPQLDRLQHISASSLHFFSPHTGTYPKTHHKIFKLIKSFDSLYGLCHIGIYFHSRCRCYEHKSSLIQGCSCVLQ